MSLSIDGYIILGPWEERVAFTMGLTSVAASPTGAWARHTRGQMDKVQAWFDRGYRLRRVNIELIEETADQDLINSVPRLFGGE